MKKTKSTVMTITNRLVSQGMGRPSAMLKAWMLCKMPLVQTKVAGVTYGQRQKALEHLRQYPTANISIQLAPMHAPGDGQSTVAVVATVAGKGSYVVGHRKQI